MTEYDYSPEAYERYTRTQQRIADWVNQTEEHRPRFSPPEAQNVPFFQTATKNLQSMFRRTKHGRSRSSSHSSSSSSFSSGTYSTSHKSPGPMPVLEPRRPPHGPQSNYIHSHRLPSSHHHPSHRHTSHQSSGYIITSPPASSPGYSYIYSNNPHASAGILISSKGSATAPPRPTNPYYAPTGYPFPQTAYPHTAPIAGSFVNHTQPQSQVQTGSQTQYIYSQTAAPQVPPQSQHPQTLYPPMVYPLTSYTYPQAQAQPAQPLPLPPQVLYQIYSGGQKRSRRSGSSRRSR